METSANNLTHTKYLSEVVSEPSHMNRLNV